MAPSTASNKLSKEKETEAQEPTTDDANNLNLNITGAASPESQANFLSKILFSWATPLFRNASDRHKVNQALEFQDLIPLSNSDRGQEIGSILESAWAKQPNPDDATLVSAIKVLIGRRFVIAGFIKFVNSSLQFTFPILLNAILKFVEDTQARGDSSGGTATAGEPSSSLPWYETYKGYWLSAILFLAMACKAITENYYFHSVYRCGFKTRAAISVAVYNKTLRLSSEERNRTTLGEMINLMQVRVDC